MSTFVSYGDKSAAKRGFTRMFKEFSGNTEDYLNKQDGKWGFSKDENGSPIAFNVEHEVAAAVPAYKVVWPGSKPEVAAPEPEPEPEPEPAEDTGANFAAFALNQLSTGVKPDVLTFTKPIVEPSIVRSLRDERNGVKRPSEGTICAHVWAVAAQLTATKTAPAIATLPEVIAAAEASGVNRFTARTQYARWRVFHGHTGKK